MHRSTRARHTTLREANPTWFAITHLQYHNSSSNLFFFFYVLKKEKKKDTHKVAVPENVSVETLTPTLLPTETLTESEDESGLA